MPAYTKRIVRQTCLDIIKDAKSRPCDKVKAAAILERMLNRKALARRKRIESAHNGHVKTPVVRMADLLEQAG